MDPQEFIDVLRPLFLGSGLRPFQKAPGPSQLASGPSLLAPGPSQLTPGPSQLAPRPCQLAPRPSLLAPRPSQLAPRLTQLDLRPSQRCRCFRGSLPSMSVSVMPNRNLGKRSWLVGQCLIVTTNLPSRDAVDNQFQRTLDMHWHYGEEVKRTRSRAFKWYAESYESIIPSICFHMLLMNVLPSRDAVDDQFQHTLDIH